MAVESARGFLSLLKFQTMKHPIFLIDPGHGGTDIPNGYRTPGKRSPLGQRGVLFEGMSNRAFAHDIALYLSLAGRKVEIVADETQDTPLRQRVQRVAAICGNRPNDYLLLSIHSNALRGEWGNHGGMEIWTSVGETKSDVYAKAIAQDLKAAFHPDTPWRMGVAGQYDKEHNFTMIASTPCPAVLLEVLFMDGIRDYERLTDPNWRMTFTQVLVSSLLKLTV